jgi:hypothetical protein
MDTSVIVWDLETVPDLRGFAAANGLVGFADETVEHTTHHTGRPVYPE